MSLDLLDVLDKDALLSIEILLIYNEWMKIFKIPSNGGSSSRSIGIICAKWMITRSGAEENWFWVIIWLPGRRRISIPVMVFEWACIFRALMTSMEKSVRSPVLPIYFAFSSTTISSVHDKNSQNVTVMPGANAALKFCFTPPMPSFFQVPVKDIVTRV